MQNVRMFCSFWEKGGDNVKKLSALMCLITFLAGLAVGLSLLYFYTPEALSVLPWNHVQPSANDPVSVLNGDVVVSSPMAALPEPSALPMDVLSLAPQVLNAIKAKDYQKLAALVHPEDGLTFVPYSTVEPGNLCFTPEEVAGAASNSSRYIWGRQDGSGFPLELTMGEYFEQYVFDVDFTAAPNIALNQVQQSGNSLENVKEAYPDSPFVEFNFPGIDADLEGMDWRSLKLVFSRYEGQWKLVALIHSQWTI